MYWARGGSIDGVKRSSWRYFHILAAATHEDVQKHTTKAIAREAGITRPKASVILKRLEHEMFVERKRLDHNKATWIATTEGISKLVMTLNRRLRIPEGAMEFVFRDPLQVVRNARWVFGKLRGIGWTDRQTRERMRSRTLGFLRKIIGKARKAENPGAYAWAATRSEKEKAAL